jgi:hypothetical protein
MAGSTRVVSSRLPETSLLAHSCNKAVRERYFVFGENAMRSFLALSLLMISGASASAATVHHTIPRHHVIVRPSQRFPGYAVPGWAYAAPPPAVHYGDTPGYNDPSKFGGSTALPIEN